MSARITIVDYGIGNLHSVVRAVEHVGATAVLSDDADAIANAERLILPGVGAFEPCATNLRNSGLADPVRSFVATGRPFLGICVGMQLLFDRSSEFGQHAGLGLIPGTVEEIPTDAGDGRRRKVPHIGWSALTIPPARTGSWDGTLLADATPGVSSAYFVHSFSARPADPADRLADADYAGFPVCAAVQRDNISGFQCHPEKSGTVGLAILNRFVGRVAG